MHVGLNLLFLIPGDTGGRETYTRELVRAMRVERPDIRFTGFIGSEAAALKDGSWLAGLDTVTLPLRTRPRAQWALAEQLLLPRAAARAGVDLLHSPANTAPAFGPFRRVVTLHDVLYKRHPELLGTVARLATGAIVGMAARTAHRLVTVSHAAQQDIVLLLGVDAERIDVVPNGLGTPRGAAATPVAQLRARFGLADRPFALVSAVRMPHKNLPRLIDALALVPPGRRPLLVMTGASGTDDAAIAARIAAHRIEADVRVLGWQEQPDLEGLFAGAACFVLPTLHEGFGLPVLEAMARGVPVACADIGPLREVAGDAALLFDPRSPGAIAEAVLRLVESPALCERLAQAGRARAALFTWQRAAQGTLASYARAMR